jgi:hypothetical protein
MAYGLKYELFFSDIERNKFKIEILEKDFEIDPFNLGTTPTQLIGTGNPAVIEWNADDDIYSPIIGSRCKLNFFATDSNTYDEFYKAGERQYKVKILEYTSFGSDYDSEELPWDLIDQTWSRSLLGSEVFYNAIWEGFIVNDGYQEAVVTAPYQISLEAIDGLGTLGSFDVPYPTDNTNPKEQMFFYLKEILKLTGHSVPIYIANDIRKDGGSANDTIFNDIEVDRYIFSNKNLTLMDAKEALRYIMKMTNSRVFQSFAKWYVVSNSNLIDNRIVQGTVAPSVADIVNEPAAPVATPVYGSPDITIIGQDPMYNDGTTYSLIVQNSGTDIVSYLWTKPDSSTSVDRALYLGSVNLSQDGDVYSVTATDANGQIDTASFTLNVQEQTVTPTNSGAGIVEEDDPIADEPVPAETPTVYYKVELTGNNNVSNAYLSPVTGTYNYTASEVGNSFSMTFNVVSTSGEFDSVSQISSISVTGGFTITKQLIADYIRLTVSGTLPAGGHIGNYSVSGAANVQQFVHSYSVSNSGLSNATVSPGSFSATAGEGKSYTKSFSINASSGYKWQNSGNVTVISSDAIYDTLTVSKTDDTTLTVTISGTIGVSDESATITVSGAPVGSGPATTLSFSPSAPYDISESNGYFDLSVTADGNFTAVAGRPWITLGTDSGATGTTTIRVKFDANTSASNRKGRIYFYPAGSSTQITSILLNQDGIA